MKFLKIFFAISGFLGVTFGAFAAHALKTKLSDYSLDIFHTAVTYQFFHTLALGLCLVFLEKNLNRLLKLAASCFAGGIIFFSGSLYALALTDIKILGAITPIGGLFFLAGWGLLGAYFVAVRTKKTDVCQ